MARVAGAPSDGRMSTFACEECVIINVNKKTWVVDVETKHSNRTISDIQVMAPYHHFSNGEGIMHLPEVGAICLVGWPSDNTPPFIMGYLGAASTLSSDGTSPERSTTEEGSDTDVSHRSNRMDLQPGDIAMATRDDNFIVLRRGGVLQLGSTPTAQRIYIPILNYVKDFAENYEMNAFGGNIAWTTSRDDEDPAGSAAASYTFHMQEFAQDAKASVRVRHFPLQAVVGSDPKTAWEVTVAKQGIDKETGDVSSAKYTLSILTDGKKTETIGADCEISIVGNDTRNVDGNIEYTAGGTAKLSAGGKATLHGSSVSLGDGATEPVPKGNVLLRYLVQLVTWLAAHTHGPPGSPPGAPPPIPPSSILSTVSKTK